MRQDAPAATQQAMLPDRIKLPIGSLNLLPAYHQCLGTKPGRLSAQPEVGMVGQFRHHWVPICTLASSCNRIQVASTDCPVRCAWSGAKRLASTSQNTSNQGTPSSPHLSAVTVILGTLPVQPTLSPRPLRIRSTCACTFVHQVLQSVRQGDLCLASS